LSDLDRKEKHETCLWILIQLNFRFSAEVLIYPTLSGIYMVIHSTHKWSARHQIRNLILMRNSDMGIPITQMCAIILVSLFLNIRSFLSKFLIDFTIAFFFSKTQYPPIWKGQKLHILIANVKFVEREGNKPSVVGNLLMPIILFHQTHTFI